MQPLMSTADVGNILGVSARRVAESVAKVPGFPKPIRIPTLRGGVGKPRWKQADIENWIAKLKP